MEETFLANESDIKEGEYKEIDFLGRPVILFKLGGGILCLHQLLHASWRPNETQGKARNSLLGLHMARLPLRCKNRANNKRASCYGYPTDQAPN